MEELQVIETTSGRQFKPWASREDVQAIGQAVLQAVLNPASVTAISSEIAGGKAAIASSINAKGGTASATESFQQLAQDIEDMPVYNEFLKLWAIVMSGSYNKSQIQGREENALAGITELIETGVPFNYSITSAYLYQRWETLTKVTLTHVTYINANNLFYGCSFLKEVNFPNLEELDGNYIFQDCIELESVNLDNVKTMNVSYLFANCTKLKSITLPELTYIRGTRLGSDISVFIAPKCSYFAASEYYSLFLNRLERIQLGSLTGFWFGNTPGGQTQLMRFEIAETDIDINMSNWTATEITSAEDLQTLNDNFVTYTVPGLKQGAGKTLTLGSAMNSKLTAESQQAVTDRGWNLAFS